jgi:hypothetical protein
MWRQRVNEVDLFEQLLALRILIVTYHHNARTKSAEKLAAMLIKSFRLKVSANFTSGMVCIIARNVVVIINTTAL